MLEPKQILNQYWGYSSFRPQQEQIIQSVLDGKDTLAMLPTGGGKSICFQVPALAKEGLCLVVSPLIALMKDQVENLVRRGIKAAMVNSSMRKREVDIALGNCLYGNYKFLYLSPERLEMESMQEYLQKLKVNLIAVDEAHCVSQWGYDFRPSYLKISSLRKIFPSVPILALTATATNQVVEDIQERLSFKNKHVIKQSFERKNLSYVVLNEEDKNERLLKILSKVGGSAIVYANTRKACVDLTNFLIKNRIQADFYHAGIFPALRNQKQDMWMKNQIRVMVATNAFGMGIDKPDVRLVIHWNMPDSLEAYYQEAGRAGRDGIKSYAITISNNADIIEQQKRVEGAYPDIELIKKVYQSLANYFQLAVGVEAGAVFDFDLGAFANNYNFKITDAYNCIRVLELDGYLSLSETFNEASKFLFTISSSDLYKFQVENKVFDDFIKLLLRSYSGVFDHYVNINETEIARRANMDKLSVVKKLTRLSELGVVNYIPLSTLPRVTYLKERVEAGKLKISNESLNHRKQRALERLKFVQDYVKAKHLCRSKMLLNYFGESNSNECGVCDYCLEKNQKSISLEELNKLTVEIKQVLGLHSPTVKQLINYIPSFSEKKILSAIEWLINEGVIKQNESGQILLTN